MADRVEFIDYDFRDKIHTHSHQEQLPIPKALAMVASGFNIPTATNNNPYAIVDQNANVLTDFAFPIDQSAGKINDYKVLPRPRNSN